jgi:hypothetical protein
MNKSEQRLISLYCDFLKFWTSQTLHKHVASVREDLR